ncbi:MAG: hypothetical protein MPW16_13025 [Candidatus Manganitrophus sp.]|nr:MAG: hypothetical protein MPW16_13025 [Candidatus Manganitrophus sp.]
MFKFNTETFTDRFQKLEKTKQWLTSLGIQTAGTRFDEVLQLNKELVEHHNNNQIDSLIKQYGHLRLWAALTEASSFNQVHYAFKNQKSHISPRAKLKKMLEGPYHSWDEDVHEGNIEGRNTLFELESASIFKRAGVKIIGFDDVDFIFKRTKFNIQCKRLHSQKKIKDNIIEASNQFYKRMKSNSNLKGIICLSVDKVIGIEEMVLKVKSPEEVRPKLVQLSNSFLTSYRGFGHSFINPNFLGVFFFFFFLAIFGEKPFFFFSSWRNFFFGVIVENFIQIMDHNLIVELSKRLQTGE